MPGGKEISHRVAHIKFWFHCQAVWNALSPYEVLQRRAIILFRFTSKSLQSKLSSRTNGS
jgi:hypothetical protein